MGNVSKTKQLLYQAGSAFGRYRIIEMIYTGRPARLLFGEDASPQTGIALDESAELLFNYNQRFLEIAASLRPRRVLVIGGGAFSFPMALVERAPDLIVDVVEIDGLLPDLARRFFGLKKHPHLNIFIEDGRKYLEQTTQKYDLIVVDAFAGMDIPHQLISIEAARQYQNHLTPGGVMALNFISAYHVTKPQLAHHLQATFEEAFSSVELYPAEYVGRLKQSDNIVMVASQDMMPNLDYLQSNSLAPLVGMQADIIHDL